MIHIKITRNTHFLAVSSDFVALIPAIALLNLESKHENFGLQPENLESKHENTGPKHENLGSKHTNMGLQHENLGSKHANLRLKQEIIFSINRLLGFQTQHCGSLASNSLVRASGRPKIAQQLTAGVEQRA